MDLPDLKKLLKIAVVGAFEAVKPYIEDIKRGEPAADSTNQPCTCGHRLGMHRLTGECTGTGTHGEYNSTEGNCACDAFEAQ